MTQVQTQTLHFHDNLILTVVQIATLETKASGGIFKVIWDNVF